MKEYEADFDQTLFYLPLSGSTFKKVYYDDLLGRAVSKFVPIVPPKKGPLSQGLKLPQKQVKKV
jgi:hypothetical protein